MRMRARKLLGTVALLALLTVWVLLAMAFAQITIASANRWMQAAYYIAAGLGWVLPAMALISWMSRPDGK
jgi:hypothetical protein